MPMGKGTYGSKKGRPKKNKMKMKGDKKVTGNRKKLDMDKDGKLTKKDFAMLRAKKNKGKA
tara:strand:+ start:851 stop:1033 length:183 start_codon:yes stop_codon:yes gene_type:complete